MAKLKPLKRKFQFGDEEGAQDQPEVTNPPTCQPVAVELPTDYELSSLCTTAADTFNEIRIKEEQLERTKRTLHRKAARYLANKFGVDTLYGKIYEANGEARRFTEDVALSGQVDVDHHYSAGTQVKISVTLYNGSNHGLICCLQTESFDQFKEIADGNWGKAGNYHTRKTSKEFPYGFKECPYPEGYAYPTARTVRSWVEKAGLGRWGNVDIPRHGRNDESRSYGYIDFHVGDVRELAENLPKVKQLADYLRKRDLLEQEPYMVEGTRKYRIHLKMVKPRG